MYSTFNEGKSVVAERSIKTLKSTIGKNVCFNVLMILLKTIITSSIVQ